MTDPAVRIVGAGKKFHIGIERQPTLGQKIRYWVRGHQPMRGFWALRNIDLEVEKGETLGIIGPNGSGKSTLLKLISGILLPDEGTVHVSGPINPFLMLGVSMLPQLTVMANLKLCAALLGFSGREFREKLDSIIDFSELHDYLYAAVADLSSGWASRVAFSIAIHTNLNILLIDESLAVGDEYFRGKCKDRMAQIKRDGKTIILVSHSMSDITENCNRVLYLKEGRSEFFGNIDEGISVYQKDMKWRVDK